jgi:hypothetical protein
MLMEAAHTLSDDSLGNDDEQPHDPAQEEEAE